MANAIPDEAIDKFRRLEHRAMTASAAVHSLYERLQQLRDEERDVRVSMSGHFQRAAVNGRIETTAEGAVTHVRDDGRVVVLAEKDLNARRLHQVQTAMADARKRRDAAAEVAGPLNGLVSACRECLRTAGWDGI